MADQSRDGFTIDLTGDPEEVIDAIRDANLGSDKVAQGAKELVTALIPEVATTNGVRVTMEKVRTPAGDFHYGVGITPLNLVLPGAGTSAEYVG